MGSRSTGWGSNFFSTLRVGVILAAGFAFLVPGAIAQESLRVGYVDLGKIREQYKQYQAALDEIKGVKEKEQGELDSMSGDFDKSVKAFELKEGLFASDEQREEELEKLRSKWSTLTEYKTRKDQELEGTTRERLAPLIEKIQNTIQDVSSTSGYHLVFKKADLAYGDPRLDITDLVLTSLNKE